MWSRTPKLMLPPEKVTHPHPLFQKNCLFCPFHGWMEGGGRRTPRGGVSSLSISLHSQPTTAFSSVSPSSSSSGCGDCFTFCRANLGQLRDQTPP
ncbi:mCG147478 [Mus musculus]|nr:mCG147478 [Mus musculus]